MSSEYQIIHGDCEQYLNDILDDSDIKFHLSFLDPPFNQGKEYENHDDTLDEQEYWDWMTRICKRIYSKTVEGGAIYFMQREKNTFEVIKALRDAGFTYQNLIIWKKKSSAVPQRYRFGKSYQIIAFFTKGERPKVFNKLRIDPTIFITEKYLRKNGLYTTDVWDDIRELTSGYYAGEEPLRWENGERAHKQQSPIRLLARIILSSSLPGDMVFDPFAGTGTTLIVAKQLGRKSIIVEKGDRNIELINERISEERQSDNILDALEDYIYTEDLVEIWGNKKVDEERVNKTKREYYEYLINCLEENIKSSKKNIKLLRKKLKTQIRLV
ncbi:MAG: DNA-methyltransferase [Candidatus Odinarchaeia archaeon]